MLLQYLYIENIFIIILFNNDVRSKLIYIYMFFSFFIYNLFLLSLKIIRVFKVICLGNGNNKFNMNIKK